MVQARVAPPGASVEDSSSTRVPGGASVKSARVRSDVFRNNEARGPMSLLRVNGSILGPNSSSRALGDIIQRTWVAAHPNAKAVERDLGANPIPATYWSAAVSAGMVPQEHWNDDQRVARALADEILGELKEAGTIIVATGLYNWGINQLVKSWIDLAFVAAPPGEKILRGKHVALVLARGGYYGEDGPKAGWDHATPWLMRIFDEVWGAKVTLVQRDFTLVGVNPALDAFREQAAAVEERAVAEAEQAGKALAASVASEPGRLTP